MTSTIMIQEGSVRDLHQASGDHRQDVTKAVSAEVVHPQISEEAAHLPHTIEAATGITVTSKCQKDQATTLGIVSSVWTRSGTSHLRSSERSRSITSTGRGI